MLLMNNQVIFAAAGNGKTYSLCAKAKAAISTGTKYVLLISYTNEGIRALEKEYKKQNYGVLDERIIIKSWYSFLLSEFIKPYQCSLRLNKKIYKKETPVTISENFISSIAFYVTEKIPAWFNQAHLQYFLNSHGDIYPDRVSHLAYLCNEQSQGKPIHRMKEIYSHIFIDELQDYAGWDLEIIKLLFGSTISISGVGDYKQATYRTNNSPKNKQYRDENIREFFLHLQKKGLCSVLYANSTRRFNYEICSFINTIHNDSDAIVVPDPLLKQTSIPENSGVYIIDYKYLKDYCEYYHPVILRYDKRTQIPFYDDNCDVFNYGGSKGATFERTVIIPVSTTIQFIEKQVKISSKQTRSKFYVACTRAKYSVVFAMQRPKESSFFKCAEIRLAEKVIPALKFTSKQYCF